MEIVWRSWPKPGIRTAELDCANDGWTPARNANTGARSFIGTLQAFKGGYRLPDIYSPILDPTFTWNTIEWMRSARESELDPPQILVRLPALTTLFGFGPPPNEQQHLRYRPALATVMSGGNAGSEKSTVSGSRPSSRIRVNELSLLRSFVWWHRTTATPELRKDHNQHFRFNRETD